MSSTRLPVYPETNSLPLKKWRFAPKEQDRLPTINSPGAQVSMTFLAIGKTSAQTGGCVIAMLDCLKVGCIKIDEIEIEVSISINIDKEGLRICNLQNHHIEIVNLSRNC